MNKYSLSFKSVADLLKYIEEQSVQFIDFNFTNILGKWLHVTKHVSAVNKDLLDNGFTFGGSKTKLKPDIKAGAYDPFAAQKTIKIFCDIYDQATKSPLSSDPRSIAKSAEKYLKKSGFADKANFVASPEFYVFNDIQVNTESHYVSYKLDGEEGAYNKGREYVTGNMGHRLSYNDSPISESPVDSLCDIRAEMLTVIESMGVSVIGHAHGKYPSQCRLEVAPASLLNSADIIQIYKHSVQNVANSYGRTATFMPKPINDDSGSSMVINQSLTKSGKAIFAGKSYAGISDNALYYLGGLLKHMNVITAFTNPTTNSYKRLAASNYMLGYSDKDNSVSCFIAPDNSINLAFPDPMANPYLAFSVILMAGLDGIDNKIHPGEGASGKAIKPICTSLFDALSALKNDHDFLLKNDVFTSSFIDEYIKLKSAEIKRVENITHPIEVDMYYSG